MRLFIAAVLPEEVKDILDSHIRLFRQKESNIKWESKNKLHITIKFIGDTSSELKNEIADCLAGVCLNYKTLSLKTGRVNFYPNSKKPRVIVLELEDSGFITKLKKDIENSLYKIGIEKDTRIFKPHITLGRIKKRSKISFNCSDTKEVTFTISDVSLVSSKLTKTGSIYNIENSFTLH